MQASRWVLIWRSQGEKKKATAVVQLDGSVLIWHMIEHRMGFNGLLFIWSTFKKYKTSPMGLGVGVGGNAFGFTCARGNANARGVRVRLFSELRSAVLRLTNAAAISST
jgi:hypothetical protein